MKRMSQSDGLIMDAMYVILEEKAKAGEQIKIRADTIVNYFLLKLCTKTGDEIYIKACEGMT